MRQISQPRIGDLATATLANPNQDERSLQGVVVTDNGDGTMQMRMAVDAYPRGMYEPGKEPPLERTFVGPAGAVRVDDSNLFGWGKDLVTAVRKELGIK